MFLLELSVGLFMHLAVPSQLFSITFKVLGALKPLEAVCFSCTNSNCAALLLSVLEFSVGMFY